PLPPIYPLSLHDALPISPPAPPAPAPAPAVEPRQERMEVSRPSFLSGCRSPEVPSAVQRQAATIRVLVQMLILPDGRPGQVRVRSEEHTSELQSRENLVC